VWWGAAAPPPPPPAAGRAGRAAWRQLAAMCVLVLGGSIQLMFLASVQPQVLPMLGVPPGDTLLVGGVVIFVSGVAAAVGSLMAPGVARVVGARSAIAWLLAASSALLLCLAPLTSIWAFSAVRFVQVLCVAPLFPIAVTGIAQQAGGQAIGMVNGARIAAGFVGPVLATTVLASASPAALYVALALLGLLCVPCARGVGRRALA
jgi:MFS family permease